MPALRTLFDEVGDDGRGDTIRIDKLGENIARECSKRKRNSCLDIVQLNCADLERRHFRSFNYGYGEAELENSVIEAKSRDLQMITYMQKDLTYVLASRGLI